MNMGCWNSGKELWDMGQGTRDTPSVKESGPGEEENGSERWLTWPESLDTHTHTCMYAETDQDKAGTQPRALSSRVKA